MNWANAGSNIFLFFRVEFVEGLISEINSVTGVQISIVLINKQMYRRANICHEGGVDHGSRIRRLQAQV